MIIGILKEPSFESRVSLLATEAALLTKNGTVIWVEKDAGLKSYCLDEDYITAGAVIKSRDDIFNGADIVLGIHYSNIPFALRNKVLIGVYQPMYNHEQV